MDKVKAKHEWIRGLTMVLRIKCACVVEGVRRSFRLPEKDGKECDFAALNGVDQKGQAFDIEVQDRKPFESGQVKDRDQGGIMVDFTPPPVDAWIVFTNCKVSTDIDGYGKRKLSIDSVFQMKAEDDTAAGNVPKPLAKKRVRAAT
jgi:hypothetical protein